MIRNNSSDDDADNDSDEQHSNDEAYGQVNEQESALDNSGTTNGGTKKRKRSISCAKQQSRERRIPLKPDELYVDWAFTMGTRKAKSLFTNC
jgi:hypothetical protein